MARLPQLVLGVDTHKDVHVAVLLDRLGRYLATASFGTTDARRVQKSLMELVGSTRGAGRRGGRVGARGAAARR